MLDIAFIREHADEVKQNIKNRGVAVDLDELLKIDEQRRELLQSIEPLRAERNTKSKSKPSDEEIAKMKKVGEQIKKLETELAKVNEAFADLMDRIPNMSHPDAPVGGEEDFAVVEEIGKELKFGFEPKDHEELMTNLGVIDFERGAKVSGSKFYFTKGDLVKLNNALLQYGMEITGKHGYELIETPDMVHEDVLSGSGFNPRGEESQIYDIEGHDLHLIGTAEIPLLGFHMNEVLDLSHGPKKYVGLSHCYRTESGAYGKAHKGIYRVHQFTKLEMFIFCKPEDSASLLQELYTIEKEICDGLGLQYRVIDTPTGDLGGPAYRKYDFEARMVMKDFGEITSASNCTDYQARRMNIKYVNDAGKKEYVHTLNGTAVVLSRFPLAIFEQFQQKDGSIAVPKVLRKYMNKQKSIT